MNQLPSSHNDNQPFSCQLGESDSQTMPTRPPAAAGVRLQLFKINILVAEAHRQNPRKVTLAVAKEIMRHAEEHLNRVGESEFTYADTMRRLAMLRLFS